MRLSRILLTVLKLALNVTKSFIPHFVPSGVNVPKPAEPRQHATKHADVATVAATNVATNVAACRQPSGLEFNAVQSCHQFTAES